MKRIVARRQILIRAEPAEVWRVHTDIDSWSRWQPQINYSRIDGAVAAGTRFRWKAGGLSISSTIGHVEAETFINWTGVAIGTRASHSWKFEASNGGTWVTTEESMEGWLVSVLALLTPRFLSRSLDTWVEALKQRVEGDSRVLHPEQDRRDGRRDQGPEGQPQR